MIKKKSLNRGYTSVIQRFFPKKVATFSQQLQGQSNVSRTQRRIQEIELNRRRGEYQAQQQAQQQEADAQQREFDEKQKQQQAYNDAVHWANLVLSGKKTYAQASSVFAYHSGRGAEFNQQQALSLSYFKQMVTPEQDVKSQASSSKVIYQTAGGTPIGVSSRELSRMQEFNITPTRETQITRGESADTFVPKESAGVTTPVSNVFQQLDFLNKKMEEARAKRVTFQSILGTAIGKIQASATSSYLTLKEKATKTYETVIYPFKELAWVINPFHEKKLREQEQQAQGLEWFNPIKIMERKPITPQTPRQSTAEFTGRYVGSIPISQFSPFYTSYQSGYEYGSTRFKEISYPIITKLTPKYQEKVNQIAEKYKDNPEKMQKGVDKINTEFQKEVMATPEISKLTKETKERLKNELIAPRILDVLYQIAPMYALGTMIAPSYTTLALTKPAISKAINIATLGVITVGLGFKVPSIVESYKISTKTGVIETGLTIGEIAVPVTAGYYGFKTGAEAFLSKGKLVKEAGFFKVKEQPSPLEKTRGVLKPISTGESEVSSRLAEFRGLQTFKYKTPFPLRTLRIIKTPTFEVTRQIIAKDIPIMFSATGKEKDVAIAITKQWAKPVGYRTVIGKGKKPEYVSALKIEKKISVQSFFGKGFKTYKPKEDLVTVGKSVALDNEQMIGYSMGELKVAKHFELLKFVRNTIKKEKIIDYIPHTAKTMFGRYTKETDVFPTDLKNLSPFAYTYPKTEMQFIKTSTGKVVAMKKFPNEFEQIGFRDIGDAISMYKYRIKFVPQETIKKIITQGTKPKTSWDTTFKKVPIKVSFKYPAPDKVASSESIRAMFKEPELKSVGAMEFAEFSKGIPISRDFSSTVPVIVRPFSSITPLEENLMKLFSTPALTPALSPALTPALSPALTPALSPALSPALTPALSPALTPALSPALSPALTPKLTPAFTPAITPKITPFIVPEIFPEISFLGLKRKIRKKKKKARDILGALPDFTAIMLGLKPQKIKGGNMKQIMAKLNKIETGFGIRTGVKVTGFTNKQEKRLMKGVFP